ncbi:hypothetical protein [Trinickia fusca]|uniref:Uncharacterized protein n=1 Tax=Trinickia fusca TaxID=2419777 RepID=A0A494X4H5_9BURK|nr:hypothetical protein [Trinickia fusca]RKP44581.1 hypothetical protein D7S89_22145 [Trinickia fusca]
MLGLTFWKQTLGIEHIGRDTSLAVVDRRRVLRRRFGALLVIAAIFAAVAVALGSPVVGLTVYLAATVPLIFFSS